MTLQADLNNACRSDWNGVWLYAACLFCRNERPTRTSVQLLHEEARLIYLGVLQVPPSQPLPHQSLWKGRHRAYSETPPNEFRPADSGSLPGSPAAWSAAGGGANSSSGSAAPGQVWSIILAPVGRS